MKKHLFVLAFSNICLAFIAIASHGLVWPYSIWLGTGASSLVMLLSALIALRLYTTGELAPPPLSILESSIFLHIVKSDGSCAKYEKLQTVVANMPNLISYVERGLKPDIHGGTIRSFEAWSNVRGGDFEETRWNINPDSEYEVSFGGTPRVGQKFQRKIRCEIADSFMKAEESFTIVFTRDIRKIELKIGFHENKPFKTAELWVSDQNSNFRYQNPPFTFNDTRTLLLLSATNPKPGTRYKVVWTW